MRSRAAYNITQKTNTSILQNFPTGKGNLIIKGGWFSSGKSAVLQHKISTGTNISIFSTVTNLIKFASVQTDNFHIFKHSLPTAPNTLEWYSLFFSYAQAKNLSSSFSALLLPDNLGLKCDNQAKQNYIITTTMLTRHCKHIISPLYRYSSVSIAICEYQRNLLCSGFAEWEPDREK